MTADARIACGLPDHPKTLKLLRELREPGAWSLVCLILWTAANRPSGDLTGFDIEGVEMAAKWQGEQGIFTAAILKVGFLEGEPGVFKLHDWADWQPWAVNRDKRIRQAQLAANTRWSKSRDGSGVHADSIAASMRTAMPIPNPTQPSPKPKSKANMRASFVAPTLEQVGAYCLERKNSVNPEQFLDYYTSNGWKVGGRTPMRDWKASIRNWERNGLNKFHPEVIADSRTLTPLTNEEIKFAHEFNERERKRIEAKKSCTFPILSVALSVQSICA